MLRHLRLSITLLALAVTPLSAAHAHPRLLKATPGADSRSAEAPQQLVLTFNESLDLALTRVTLERDEVVVRLDSLRLAVGDDKTVLANVVGTLAPGRYSVKWQVTGDDGHPVRGTFTFEVLPRDGTSPRPTHHAR